MLESGATDSQLELLGVATLYLIVEYAVEGILGREVRSTIETVQVIEELLALARELTAPASAARNQT